MSYLARLGQTPDSEKWPLAREWMTDEPQDFFAELRRHRPVLVLPDVTLVSLHADCVEILRRHDVFSVRPYAAKQGVYWMAQDDTARHWRDKSVMRAILDRETIPEMRSWIGEEARKKLQSATQPFDAVAGLTRAIPIALVQHWFGYVDIDPAELFEWSYWNQMDAFWNQPFQTPPVRGLTFDDVIAERQAANERMRAYLIGLVQARAASLQSGDDGTDVVSRLLRLSGSGALRFDISDVVLNVGGLLIGAVETTSHAVVNALEVLCSKPDWLSAAKTAAREDVPDAIDGFVFEALRFRPAFPYFFRMVEVPVTLAPGTDHATLMNPGTIVLATTQSAMMDEAGVEAPNEFRPERGMTSGFTFGLGLHECLGRAIGAAIVPEIVRQALRLDDLQMEPVDRRDGPVPERWIWTWTT